MTHEEQAAAYIEVAQKASNTRGNPSVSELLAFAQAEATLAVAEELRLLREAGQP